MRKNNAGLTILEKGDIVRIGNGRVHYVVEYGETAGMLHVQSLNTLKSRAVEREKLTLVQSVQDAAYEAGCSVEELTSVDPVETFSDLMNRVDAHEEGRNETPAKEDTSYQKAVLLALNLKGKHVYAGTVRPNVKAKRRGLGRRQKASRKANR